MAYTEDLVGRGPVILAVRDYGGPGEAVILLHGGGRDSRDWDPLARRLQARHRVLVFDLCDHGQSTACIGPWTFAEGLADLEAVIAQYALENAVIAGHSLGGMLATFYGARHPACRGVVNIDGIGVSVPPVFPGPDPARHRQRVQTMIDLLASANSPERSAVAGDPVPVEQALARAVLGCDIFAVTQTVQCLLLFIAAQEPAPTSEADDMTVTMHLWRMAVQAEFARLAARQPNIQWRGVSGDHLSILHATAPLADHLSRFMDSLPR